MKANIRKILNNPRELEKLYRIDKLNFKKEFDVVFPDIQDNIAAQIWNERLNFEKEEISWGTKNEWIFVIVASLIAGIIAKLPEITGINPDFFYPRNMAFIFFPLLAAFFAWKQDISIKKKAWIFLSVVASVIYINALPGNENNDSLILACVHMPLFIWALTGFAFVGDKWTDLQRRLDYLRFNGDLVVMTAIMLIAGVLLAGITLGLFELIGLKVEEFYFQYIGIVGLAAAPIIGTFLVRTNPQLVNKVSPVIAKVFTPLVFATLVIYLGAVIYTGKDPFNDREFLLIFNLLLIGVMAIILFAIAGTSKTTVSKIELTMLLALSIMTIVINSIALSAILFRISEWGMTPNRLAVLGGNILILGNLLLVAYRIFRSLKERNDVEKIELSIASYLSVYMIWTIFVTFGFPLLFGFK